VRKSIRALKDRNQPISAPTVAVIVLNWNSYDLVAQSLRSLAQSEYSNLRVILVDNGSTDSSSARLIKEFTWLAAVVRIPTNSGFTGGANAGIRAAREIHADYYLLLTGIVAPDAIRNLVRTAETDRRIGAMNPKIFNLDRPEAVWHARGHFNWWLGLTRSHANSRERAPEQTQDVNFLTGSALLLRAVAVDDVGLLDERFFMYFEDLDYTRRILSAGYRAVYEPTGHVWHAVQGSVRRNVAKGVPIRFLNRNRLLLMSKHATRWQWMTFLPTLLLWHVLAHVVVYSFRRQWQLVPAIFVGSYDYWKMRTTLTDTGPAT
jgi:GT2 family glycosyltransferase